MDDSARLDHAKRRVARELQHGQATLDRDEGRRGWDTLAGDIRRRRRMDFFSEPLAGRGGAEVLEIGCGIGTFTEGLATLANVTAIDVSPALLARAAERLPHVRFELRDAHDTGYPEATFDCVVGCSVLHHLDWDLALREIRRILKPGGVMRFCEPNLINPQIFVQKNWPWLKRKLGDSPDEYAFTRGQISGALARARFVDIDVRAFEFLHPSTPPGMVPAVLRLERVIEWSVLGRFGGSLKIAASRPGAVHDGHPG